MGFERRGRNVEVQAVPEFFQLRDRELLHLMGGVPGLEVPAERPSLDGVGQDYCRMADVLGCRRERRVDLLVVVTASGQGAYLGVGRVRDHRPEARVAAGEVLAGVRGRLYRA